MALLARFALAHAEGAGHTAGEVALAAIAIAAIAVPLIVLGFVGAAFYRAAKRDAEGKGEQLR